MSFARRLSKSIQDRGFTAADLARLIGVSNTAVSNWVNGRTIPRPQTLADIARALGVTEQYLLAGVANAAPPPRSRTISEIIDTAQREIASASGMPLDRVRVRVEYLSE